MPMRDHFLAFAGYNRWANRRLYAAAATIPDAEYRRDRRGFFRSIHGTLNHVLVGDRIWFKRLSGVGEAPNRLDTILYEHLAELRRARETEDERIAAYVEELNETTLERPFEYRDTRGNLHGEPLRLILAHIFNHQTHHRGQAHDMLSQLGPEPPSLDMILYVREVLKPA